MRFNGMLLSEFTAMIFFAYVAMAAAAAQDEGLTLTLPRDGQVFHVGDSMSVVWSLDSGVAVTGYLVELSPDKGRNWARLGRVDATMDAFAKNACRFLLDSVGSNPARPSMGAISLVSDSCIVRIRDYQNPGIVASSIGYISVQPRGSDAVVDGGRRHADSKMAGSAGRMVVLRQGLFRGAPSIFAARTRWFPEIGDCMRFSMSGRVDAGRRLVIAQ